MDCTILDTPEKNILEIPKVFWKYYDLYRREKISIEEYSLKSKLPQEEILRYLSAI